MSGLIVLFWFVADGVALRYLVGHLYLLYRPILRASHRSYSSGSCPACMFYGMLSVCRPLTEIPTILMYPDDTIARKVNESDASAFAKICGCFPSQGEHVWIVLSKIEI